MENNQATVVYATDIKKASVVYVNTDLNEGRGCQVPIQVCVSETAAKRYAQKRGVQGSNADVLERELYLINGEWYGPVHLVPPSVEDARQDLRRAAYEKVIRKCEEAALTPEEIEVLRKGL